MKNSRNIQLGVNGERFVNSIFERIIGKTRLKKGWYQIKHQDWDNNYNYGTGVDIEILEDKKPLIDVEVKNFKKQPKPYGTDIALKEVIPRFDGSMAPIKLLFITFLCLLTVKAKQLIRQAGIRIIEIGNWIIKATWRETYRKFMLARYRHLKQLLHLKPLRKSVYSNVYSFKSVSSFVNSSNTVTGSNAFNHNKTLDTTHAIIHDTNIDYKLTNYIPSSNNNSNEQENAKNT